MIIYVHLKPLEPIEEMLDYATELKLKKAMTIILGMGETFKDYALLKDFVKKT
jgi:biotin synthase-like enzyme